MTTLDDLFQIIEKGGPGSGNLGHAGVPGHQGGSAPKGGGSSNPKGKETLTEIINTIGGELTETGDGVVFWGENKYNPLVEKLTSMGYVADEDTKSAATRNTWFQGEGHQMKVHLNKKYAISTSVTLYDE